MTKKILEVVESVEQKFIDAKLFYGHGTDNPLDEAVFLVFTVLNIEFDCSEEVLQSDVEQQSQQLISKLCADRITTRKPMAYLLNRAWFCGRPYFINENVLVPRSPIAELIEQQFQPWVDAKNIQRILDIGTGSGCIAIASAFAFPDAVVDASDISPAALEVTRQNINQHDMESRVNAIHSDVFDSIPPNQYDIIISNPPYVPAREIQELPEEYRHEPRSGLHAEDNGLSIVKRILSSAGKYLSDNGILIVEVGYSQSALINAFPDLAFFWFEFEYGGEGVFMLNKEQLVGISV